MAAYRAIKTFLVVGLIVGVPGYARAQGQAGVGVVTTLVGEATVTRAAMAQDQALKKRDDVFPKDLISTKERSLVHVLMGGKALLTVRELSVLTVTEEGGRAMVNLQSGKVGLAVVRERMRPGDVIEVQTPHAVAAVRGTVLVVEIVPSGTSTNVHLLHGKLDVSLRSNPAAPPVRLESSQSVSASSNTLGTIRPLSPAAAASVTASLQPGPPTRTGLPEKFQAKLGERQRALAVETLEGAAGNGTVHKAQGAQARAEAKSKIESRSGRDSVDVVSDVGDGIGMVSGGAFGVGNGDSSGISLGNGFASGLVGGSAPATGSSSGPVGTVVAPIGSSPSPVGSGLTAIVPAFLQKLKLK